MNWSQRHTSVPFETALPRAEMIPLTVVRQSLYRFSIAGDQAKQVAEEATKAPEDLRLARCSTHLEEAAEISRRVAARAVRAVFGDGQPVVFIRDYRNEPSLYRVDLGDEPTLSIVRPGDLAFPSESEVYDLPQAELSLGRQVVKNLILDPDQQSRCLAKFEEMNNEVKFEHHLGGGGHNPGSMADMAIGFALGL